MTLLVENKKPPTIQDLAAAVGLHTSTVSLALSGKGTISVATRRKVLDTARALGYRPNPLAQRLASITNSSSLVCILSSPLDVGLSTQKLVLIQDALVSCSLEVPIYTYAGPAANQHETTNESHVAQVRQICRQRPRAIICAGSAIHPSVYPELEKYQSDGGIVVSYDVPTPLECDQVIFDREDNAYRATLCLLEAGHRDIGFAMSSPPSWSSEAKYEPWTSRLKGFGRALAEFGLPFHDEWLFYQNVGYENGGIELARRFLEMRGRPTGMCVVNDYVAMAFMVEAIRGGIRVPDDISIVCHDNQPITTLCPVPMTSASQPIGKIADAVVAMLMERINGFGGPGRTTMIQGELVPRQSVARPPAE